MPGAAKSGEKAIRLESVAVAERTWIRGSRPTSSADARKDLTTYVVRRGERAGWVGPAGCGPARCRGGPRGEGHRAGGRDEAERREGRQRARATRSSCAGRRARYKRHPGSCSPQGGYCEVTIEGALAQRQTSRPISRPLRWAPRRARTDGAACPYGGFFFAGSCQSRKRPRPSRSHTWTVRQDSCTAAPRPQQSSRGFFFFFFFF